MAEFGPGIRGAMRSTVFPERYARWFSPEVNLGMLLACQYVFLNVHNDILDSCNVGLLLACDLNILLAVNWIYMRYDRSLSM